MHMESGAEGSPLSQAKNVKERDNSINKTNVYAASKVNICEGERKELQRTTESEEIGPRVISE